MMVQTFLIMNRFCSLGISLESKLDAIENAWATYHSTKGGCIQQAKLCERGNVGVILPSS